MFYEDVLRLQGLYRDSNKMLSKFLSLKNKAGFLAITIHIVFILCFVDFNKSYKFTQSINLQKSNFSIARFGIDDNQKDPTKSKQSQTKGFEKQNTSTNEQTDEKTSDTSKNSSNQGSEIGVKNATSDYNATYQIGSDNNPAPSYPQFAIDHEIGGLVELEVEILLNGKVSNIKIKRSSGFEILDLSAKNTVKKWIFNIAKNNNLQNTEQKDDEQEQPIKMTVPIEFVIK
jgi:TonB family protein